MNKMMHYAVLALAATALQARAQEATPAPAPEAAPAPAAAPAAPASIVVQGTPAETKVEPGEVEEKLSVEDRISEILTDKEWDNYNVGPDGKPFFIAKGIAEITAPVDSPNYNNSRMIAFDRAMLLAKQEMAEFIASKISQDLQFVEERQQQADEEAVAERLPDTPLTTKIKQLIAAKLDNALRAEGVDPKKDEPQKVEEAKKKLLQSKSFSKLIKSSATSAIAGLSCYQTIEGTKDKGKAGQIGVIVRWSPLMQEMAASIVTHQSVKQGEGRMSIAKQLPKKSKDLLSVFGVKPMFDKNGNVTLVAFAQVGAPKEDAFFAESARERAKEQARAMIASFAGEVVAVSKTVLEAETAEAYEDGSITVEDTSAYKKKIEAATEEIEISGISTARTWECKHPLSGRTVYGCVVSWSPKSAQLATTMKELIAAPKVTPAERKAAEQAAAAAAAKPAPEPVQLKQTLPPQEEKPKPTAKSYYSEGFASEEL